MTQTVDSTKTVGYASALIVIGLAAAAVVLTARSGAPALPPIKDVRIDPGFVGQQPFGFWTLICENATAPPGAPAPASVRLCRTNARVLVRGPDNAPLLAAGLNIVMMKSRPQTAIIFRLPAAAGAAASINFAIDGNTMFRAPLRCTPSECIAQGAAPPAAIDQMRAGRALSLIYTVRDREQKERKVQVNQLLHGFRQAYDAMIRAIAA